MGEVFPTVLYYITSNLKRGVSPLSPPPLIVSLAKPGTRRRGEQLSRPIETHIFFAPVELLSGKTTLNDAIQTLITI
jgi:hypothetical protein